MRTLTIVILLLFTCTLPVSAEVYRWVDSKGVVHYSDKPLAKGAHPAKLPALQTYQPAPLPDTLTKLSTPLQDKVGRAEPLRPKIVAPADKATIRDAQHHVDVRVDVALTPGEGLVYYVDGKAQNQTPTRRTQYVLSKVYRGTHTLSVALTDAQGKPITMSGPITVYMKPPRVQNPS